MNIFVCKVWTKFIILHLTSFNLYPSLGYINICIYLFIVEFVKFAWLLTVMFVPMWTTGTAAGKNSGAATHTHTRTHAHSNTIYQMQTHNPEYIYVKIRTHATQYHEIRYRGCEEPRSGTLSHHTSIKKKKRIFNWMFTFRDFVRLFSNTHVGRHRVSVFSRPNIFIQQTNYTFLTLICSIDWISPSCAFCCCDILNDSSPISIFHFISLHSRITL